MDTLFSSFGLALASSLLAGLWAFFWAVLLDSFRFPMKTASRLLLSLPILIPPAALTSLVQCYISPGQLGPLSQGPLAYVIINALRFAPIFMWLFSLRLQNIRTAEVSFARSSLSPIRSILLIQTKRLAPTALQLLGLVFILQIGEREIAGYTGIESLGQRILACFGAMEKEGQALALSALLILATLPACILLGRWLANQQQEELQTRPADRQNLPPIPGWQILLLAILLCWAWALYQMIGLASQSKLELFRLWGWPFASELMRCAFISLVSILLAWRSAFTLKSWQAVFILLVLLGPSCLAAFGLLHSIHPYCPDWVLERPILLSVAQFIRFSGVALIFARLAHNSIPLSERKAAAHLPQKVRRYQVILPRSAPWLYIGFIVLWVLHMGEVDSAALLAPAGYNIPIIELHQLLHFRYDSQAAQLATLFSLVGLVGALCLWLRPIKLSNKSKRAT